MHIGREEKSCRAYVSDWLFGKQKTDERNAEGVKNETRPEEQVVKYERYYAVIALMNLSRLFSGLSRKLQSD